MVDYTDPRWNESDSQNTSPSPNGIPTGSAPSAVPAVIRAGMGAQKRSFDRSNAMGLCTNSGNAYTLTYDVPPSEYTKGEFFSFFAAATNTDVATLRINGMSAKAWVQGDGTAFKAGDIVSGAPVTVAYDGTQFRTVTASGNPAFKGGTINGGTIWAASNDGAGSTLDADLLDAHEGTWYQDRANHTGTQDVATITGLQALLDQMVPAGAVMHFSLADAPAGWVVADGRLLDRATYPKLWANGSAVAVSEATWSSGYYGRFSTGNGTTNFRIPDLRGAFIRPWDKTRGLDTDRDMGNLQDHAVQSHAHGVTDPGHAHSGYTDAQGQHTHTYNRAYSGSQGGILTGSSGYLYFDSPQTGAAGNHAHNVGTYAAKTNISINAAGGVETRPKNISLLTCIKT